MTTRAEIVAYVKSLEGIHETNGDNRNIITAAYGDNGDPWCAMTTWYVFNHFGIDLRSIYTQEWASTVSGANAAKTRGDWRNGLAGIEPGDLIYYKIPGGDAGYVNHTGIYAAPPALSIDGNWGNQLQAVHHDSADVVGYIDVSRLLEETVDITDAQMAAIALKVWEYTNKKSGDTGDMHQAISDINKAVKALAAKPVPVPEIDYAKLAAALLSALKS